MRHRTARLVVPVVLIAALAGCAVSDLDSAAPEPRKLGDALRSFHAAEDPSARVPDEDLPQPTDGLLTLRHALALALMRNPELAAFSWEVRAAEARVLQARLRPNPEIEFEVEEMILSGGGYVLRNALLALTLGQVIELGGKRTKRAQAAQYERDLAAWDYEAKRLDVYTQAARAYIDLLAAQKRLDLAHKTLRLAERAQEVVAARVEAGKVAAVEASKALVELTTSGVAVQRAENDVHVARRALAAQWGSTAPRFDRVAGDLTQLQSVPPYDRLVGYLTENPDLARWTAEMALRRASEKLERARAVPDLGLGVGAEHSEESNERTGILGFATELPIFDRNQGGILEARYRRARSDEERRAVTVRIHTELYRTWRTLHLAHREATALQNDALPATRRAFDAALEGYRQGKWAYLEVLDAQRTLFSTQAQWIDALSSYHKALADAERLIGRRLDDAAAPSVALNR